MTPLRDVSANGIAVADGKRRLAQLRREIGLLEGETEGFTDSLVRLEEKARARMAARLALGAEDFDADSGGGVPLSGLSELQTPASRDSGSLTGFLTALLVRLVRSGRSGPVLWIMPRLVGHESGLPHGLGLLSMGFQPSRFLFARPSKALDALWIAEEACVTRGLGAVIMDWREPGKAAGLKETRRLHMRAQAAGMPIFLLRHGTGGDGKGESGSAAPLRLLVEPAPSLEDRVMTATGGASLGLSCGSSFTLAGSIGPPGFAVTISKNKWGPIGRRHILHWSRDEHVFFASKTYGKGTGTAGGDQSLPSAAPVVPGANASRHARLPAGGDRRHTG